MSRSDYDEPCGVMLMRLIDTQSLAIARREIKNADKMCLYRTGEYWHGFERSAYYLSRIYPEAQAFVVNHPDTPFPIVGISVADKVLRKHMRTLTAHRKSDDYVEYNVSAPSTDKYGAWHSGKVKEFRV